MKSRMCDWCDKATEGGPGINYCAYCGGEFDAPVLKWCDTCERPTEDYKGSCPHCLTPHNEGEEA